MSKGNKFHLALFFATANRNILNHCFSHYLIHFHYILHDINVNKLCKIKKLLYSKILNKIHFKIRSIP